MDPGSEKVAGLGTAAAPAEISLAFTNLEITRERLEEGKPMLMIDRTETQRALNILQTAFGDQDEANNDGSIQSSTRPEPLARDEPQPDAANAPAGAISLYDKDGKRKSQVTLLIELAVGLVLFRDPDGLGYAEIAVNHHREVWPIQSAAFRDWLAGQYFSLTRKGANRNAIGDALATIEARAKYGGTERPIFTRVAGHGGNIYVDLCDPRWQVIEVSPDGWKLLDRSPVMFVRRRGMASLPEPERGGTLDPLWSFLNIATGDRPLIAGWLLAAFHPKGPYPVLVLQGEQGTAKSTAARLLRSLVDPSSTPLKALPKEERDLLVSAVNSWVVALDNLSGLQPWQSDALCRLATGGGLSARQLYTDLDEVAIEIKRPCILNGIDDIAIRGDLVQRSLILILAPISDEQRQEENELFASFDHVRGKLLGALLNAISGALRNYPQTHLVKRPRMADFAKWVTASEPTLGWRSGTFLEAYQGNLNTGVITGLEASPVGQAVLSLMENRREWVGTPTALLGALREHVDDQTAHSKAWPQAPRGLSNALRRLAPSLRRVGIETASWHSGDRYITLTKRVDATDAKSDPSSVGIGSEKEKTEDQTPWDHQTCNPRNYASTSSTSSNPAPRSGENGRNRTRDPRDWTQSGRKDDQSQPNSAAPLDAMDATDDKIPTLHDSASARDRGVI